MLQRRYSLSSRASDTGQYGSPSVEMDPSSVSARYKAFMHTASSVTQLTASRAYACRSVPDTSTSASWQWRGIRVSCLRECAAPPARPPPSRACQARTSTRTTPATPASTTAPMRPRRHRSSLAHRPPLQAPAPLGCSLNSHVACAHAFVGPGAHLQGPRERYEHEGKPRQSHPPCSVRRSPTSRRLWHRAHTRMFVRCSRTSHD